MKKILALILALIMTLSLVACGVSDDLDAVSDLIDEVADKAESDDKDAGKSKSNGSITFSEVVAVDNDECSIKITEIDPDDTFGYLLKSTLENKSSDKTYYFTIDYATVNGVLCNPLFSASVAADKKANEDISISEDSFNGEDIGDYTDIMIRFRVYDDEDWSVVVAEETVHIYPYGEDKATKYVRKEKSSDNVIVDNKNIKVTVLSCGEDDFWGYMVSMSIENKTDKNVMVTAEDVSVNGFMADPYFAISVPAGISAYTYMEWSDETFEDNGITDVEEIEFNLRAYDEDNWGADDLANQTVTFKP